MCLVVIKWMRWENERTETAKIIWHKVCDMCGTAAHYRWYLRKHVHMHTSACLRVVRIKEILSIFSALYQAHQNLWLYTVRLVVLCVCVSAHITEFISKALMTAEVSTANAVCVSSQYVCWVASTQISAVNFDTTKVVAAAINSTAVYAKR